MDLNQEIIKSALKAYQKSLDSKLKNLAGIFYEDPNECREAKQLVSSLDLDAQYLFSKTLTSFLKIQLEAYNGNEQAKKKLDEMKEVLSQYRRMSKHEDHS